MGGENNANEIADGPILDRRMIKSGGQVTIYKLSGVMGFADATPHLG